MNLNSLVLNGFLAVAFVAAPVVSMAAPKSGATGRDKVIGLLQDFREKANDAANRAGGLQSTARSTTASWEAHALGLDYLKNDINEMGRYLADLDKARDSATVWEKEAIDQAHPILKQMAENTQSALLYLNDNQNDLFVPAYTKYINNLADESQSLADSVDHYLEFAKLHRQENRLEKTLGISGGSF